jgi:hypothetical protein
MFKEEHLMTDQQALAFFTPHISKLIDIEQDIARGAGTEYSQDQLVDLIDEALWSYEYLPVHVAWRGLPPGQGTRVLDAVIGATLEGQR